MNELLVVTPTMGCSAWLSELVERLADMRISCRHALVCPAARRRELEQRYPWVMVIEEQGVGMYRAINDGLRSIRDWAAFTYINDDDLLLPGFDAAWDVAQAIAKLNRPSVVYGNVELIGSEGGRLGRIPISSFPSLNRALYAERLEPVYQHGTIITRAAWEQHGGFDETFRFCGDSEYLARLCVRGVPAVRVGATVAAFRLRKGQLTKNRAAMIDERRRVDEKLGLLAGPNRSQRLVARWAFRLTNAPVYAERIARHGFVSFDELLERGD